MKFLIIGDLHGRKPQIKTKDFDAIICVGDFCCDKKIGKLYKKYFKFIKQVEEKKEDYLGFEDFIRKEMGLEKYDKYLEESLHIGRKILEYINSFQKPVFIVPGNWDQSYGKSRIKDIEKDFYTYRKAFYDWYLGNHTNKVLTDGLKNVYDCQYKLHKFDNFNIIGYGLSSGPERLGIKIKDKNKLSKTKLEKIEKLKKALSKIKEKLEKEYKKRDKLKQTIFISHNIPYNTKLDIVKDKGSVADKRHTGSIIAKDFCEKQKPLVCIGGHIHEGRGKDKIGNTLLINAGFGGDVNTILEIKNGKVKKVEFFGKNGV